MCWLSRSPVPVVGVRRLAKIPQRFRNLLCGVCHSDIVPFLGPVPEGSFLPQTASGGRFGQDDDQRGIGAGRSLSHRRVSTAYRPATGHTGHGGRGQALRDRIVLRRVARRGRARDRRSTRPPSGFPVAAACPPPAAEPPDRAVTFSRATGESTRRGSGSPRIQCTREGDQEA